MLFWSCRTKSEPLQANKIFQGLLIKQALTYKTLYPGQFCRSQKCYSILGEILSWKYFGKKLGVQKCYNNSQASSLFYCRQFLHPLLSSPLTHRYIILGGSKGSWGWDQWNSPPLAWLCSGYLWSKPQKSPTFMSYLLKFKISYRYCSTNFKLIKCQESPRTFQEKHHHKLYSCST